ncbi:L-serine ammonia-lyase [Allopusillimonas soli]|uniref:L-serine dehydratase n=1 Tax=Allopusillimonas soli TaxID=659016 RepID=A0A853FDQ4_9BURK|nr:L-serine ammonia-lyase [Allopusillimonas soli]NYT36970.1 L-serine ammonia-lyase [Allopusillimonas soli]TEA75418.1 L-serine ammonia-lyase [Allopusillimonas soli]
MFLSIFDVFKIGVGPSSSHTMGPMTAAVRFLSLLRDHDAARNAARVRVTLYGSLAYTGRGHATDRAVCLGLLGHAPATLDLDAADSQLVALREHKVLRHSGLPHLAFDPQADIVFNYGPALPGHANGLIFEALQSDGRVCVSETYYSIGGGFVVTASEREHPTADSGDRRQHWPYPFDSAAQMLQMAEESGLTIAQMKFANECSERPATQVQAGVTALWKAMDACIERGLNAEGQLPGGLKVNRRAAAMRRQLESERNSQRAQPHAANDWLSVYAMAVNEENAAGGKVVTSPTNGAAGVLPAVLRYYLDHCRGADPQKVPDFLLTAAAIGGLIKYRASISGAEAGCQGEVGSAASMAAAGFCAVLGGTPRQIENAAEIALEHHLGMTCDPVGGLVQVPCIERNGIGATKAVTAASLALRGDGTHFMPLDNCIEAMRQTGEEMSTKYKETSQGGLAVNLPEC